MSITHRTRISQYLSGELNKQAKTFGADWLASAYDVSSKQMANLLAGKGFVTPQLKHRISATNSILYDVYGKQAKALPAFVQFIQNNITASPPKMLRDLIQYLQSQKKIIQIRKTTPFKRDLMRIYDKKIPPDVAKRLRKISDLIRQRQAIIAEWDIEVNAPETYVTYYES